jgi:hypothetical protein
VPVVGAEAREELGNPIRRDRPCEEVTLALVATAVTVMPRLCARPATARMTAVSSVS